MGLPKVQINIGGGNLGQSPQTDDGVVGLVITGVTVAGAGNVTVGEAYQIFSLTEAQDMGIVEGGVNDIPWKAIRDFYAQAGTGAELWFMLVAGVAMPTAADLNEEYAKKLLTEADGRIRLIAISIVNGSVTQASGLDEDVHNAVPLAQALAVDFASRDRPVRVVLDGSSYSGTPGDLTDYKSDTKNRVAILIGNDDGSAQAAVGLLLGRKAANPVQRSIGRVKDGPIIDGDAYFTDGTKIKASESAWDSIHDKGYIFFRSFVGKAGWYFTDSPTLTAATDDYNDLARGLVIDKAHLVAYGVYVDEILEEIPLTQEGTLHPAIIKSWESKVESVLNQVMTANGEVSAIGVTIDPEQNILSSGQVVIYVKVLPVGYAKVITIPLSYATTIE